MTLEPIQYVLGVGSGLFVGFILGLVGGGGSILAVPLMVYLVGVPAPHVAIGTSALVVAINAGANLVPHARQRTIKWRCAGMFAAAGVGGAYVGSSLGMAFDGQKLLFLFALLMIFVGTRMLKKRGDPGNPDVDCHRENAPKVIGYGGATGLLSGFFGIGGGFLIVPGLMSSTGMPMRNAVGSSLVAVVAFGLMAALNYALSGLVDWALTVVFVGGGIVGGFIGSALSHRLSVYTGALNTIFALLIFLVAAYMLWRSALELNGRV